MAKGMRGGNAPRAINQQAAQPVAPYVGRSDVSRHVLWVPSGPSLDGRRPRLRGSFADPLDASGIVAFGAIV